MFKSKNFTSISSDHNLFDLDLMFARILKELNLTEKQFAVKAREYFQAKLSYMSELELANTVSNFLTRDLDYMTFLESMDILGMAVELKVTKLDKLIPEHEPDAAGTVPNYPAIYDAKVSVLDTPLRVINCLRYGCQIEYVGQLVRCTEDFILKGVGVGPTALMHIKAAVAKEGLSLNTDVGNWKSPAEKNLQDIAVPRFIAPKIWSARIQDEAEFSPLILAHLKACGMVYVGDLIEISYDQCAALVRGIGSDSEVWDLTNIVRANNLRFNTDTRNWVRPT